MKFKTKILAIIFMLILIPITCFADFSVKSDYKDFDFTTGVYNLSGNVTVQFPVQNETMTVVADKAKVELYQQQVHSSGNVKLQWGALSFACAKVDVFHQERTAYMEGGLVFDANGQHITSSSGTYCWKTKIATFSGNVVHNGTPKGNSLTYDFNNNSFR